MEFSKEHADTIKETARGVQSLTAVVPGIEKMLGDHEERLREREAEAVEVKVKQERMGSDLNGAFGRVRSVADELDACKEMHSKQALNKVEAEKQENQNVVWRHIQFFFMLVGAGGTVVGVIWMVAGK